ncbi:MAG: type IV secretion system protein [Alphaproteobacteria bacterium]|nr:type IV secretion system protein [Alphaproteobacteria bacterium]
MASKLKIKSWYSNRYQIVVVQRNILLLFTLISMFSVAVAVIFVKNIMSSKSIEPYVIQVEEKSGIATVVNQLTAQHFTGDQAIRRYFINNFIHLASGYNPETYKQDVEKVRLYSNPGIYADYRNRINTHALGSDTRIEVRIKSVQFTDDNNAQIRIARQISVKDKGSTTKDEVISFGFYFAPETNLTMEERLINPLGFQVNKYQIADEVFSY